MLRGRASYIEKHWLKVTPKGGHYLAQGRTAARRSQRVGAGLLV